MKRRLLYAVMALLLVGAVAGTTVQAGVLTAGNYTYLLQGREIGVPVDIITISGAVLVPMDLLAAMGVSASAVGDTISLLRGSVRAQLTLGQEVARIEGADRTLSTYPVSISGRPFVPADVLPYLGYSLELDGKFVVMRDYAANKEFLSLPTRDPDYERARAERTVSGSVTGSTSGAYGQVTVTALTRELLRDERLNLGWGTRVRLLSMLPARTLLLVTLQNSSDRAFSLDPAKLSLVDDQRRQYDYQNIEIPVDGTVTTSVAPQAIRTSVLVYDRAPGSFTLFYETSSTTLGRVFGP